MMRLTESLARAVARDAGDRAMRAGGRTVWSQDDYAVSVAAYDRLWPTSSHTG